MKVTCPRCRVMLSYAEHRPLFCSQCGCALTPPSGQSTEAYDPAATEAPARPWTDAETLPETIGGYRLLRPLGSGGMGTVYEAEDGASGRHVALKLIAPDYADSRDAIERFRREGRLASTLAHPRCVFVLAADEEANRPYIVMELMPGRTLGDLVAEQGPLPLGTAIAYIFDVLDGLQEAHRLGFIHRDVKPSNCFLDAEGRVKVGDFGLAKSLVKSDHLTQTGAFLGTLLFAAPEQIKGEPLDPQTDVYAVAATLYFLLTGQPPFAGTDAAATLARTVSEPAPPMRKVRPELDPALDAVVLRGLERERARRWRSLAEFKSALFSFLPAPQTVASLGERFVAYLLDSLVLLLLSTLFTIVLGIFVILTGTRDFVTTVGSQQAMLLPLIVDVLYFVVLEGLWGASLGKRLLRLRVRRASGSLSPGLVRVLLRTVIFFILNQLGPIALLIGTLVFEPAGMDTAAWAWNAPTSFMLVHLLPLIGTPLGIVLLLAPMRARNGYRGLHERLSDTRTVHLPRAERRLVLTGRPRDWPLSQPEQMPKALGPFTVRGAIRWDKDAKVLLGQHHGLGRSVWIWLRPATDAPLSAARRDISRPTRLRWLACGRHENEQWDAFLIFHGSPLPRPAKRREEAWPRALSLLEQLTDELATASAEGALPDTLQVEQVWVGLDGQCQFLDIPWSATEVEVPSSPDRALTLLANVAARLLEVQPRTAGQTGPVRAPLPLRARPILDRLLGVDRPYRDVAEFQTALKTLANESAQVAAPRRAAHLAVLAAFLFLGMGSCMLSAGWLSQFLRFGNLLATIHEKERILIYLEQGALRGFAARAVNPDPLIRLQAIAQLEADYQLRDRLRQSADNDRQHLAARRESGSWLMRNALMEIEKRISGQLQVTADRIQPDAFHSRSRAQQLVDDPFGESKGQLPAAVWILAIVLWPVLWVIWALLVRGGISYRLAGIALVRGDGRPASRLQCAWRAFLVWAPLTGLLVLSFWLEDRYWTLWRPDFSQPWMLSLASAVWFAALLLLIGYVLLALWRPARTLHDRLAGVYLVSR